MKCLLVLCVVVAAALAQEKYTDKYDNIDLDEIIGNPRLMKGYTDCMLDKGKCTSEGKELKDHLQDAMQTGCSKCTDKQKDGATKVIDHLIKNELAIWKELCAKYDPEGKWRKKYEDEAKSRGIVIPAE